MVVNANLARYQPRERNSLREFTPFSLPESPPSGGTKRRYKQSSAKPKRKNRRLRAALRHLTNVARVWKTWKTLRRRSLPPSDRFSLGVAVQPHLPSTAWPQRLWVLPLNSDDLQDTQTATVSKWLSTESRRVSVSFWDSGWSRGLSRGSLSVQTLKWLLPSVGFWTGVFVLKFWWVAGKMKVCPVLDELAIFLLNLFMNSHVCKVWPGALAF